MEINQFYRNYIPTIYVRSAIEMFDHLYFSQKNSVYSRIVFTWPRATRKSRIDASYSAIIVSRVNTAQAYKRH